MHRCPDGSIFLTRYDDVAAVYQDHQRFVSDKRAWIHIDMMGWNPSARPGRPKGGEAQGMRALFRLVEERYRR